MNKTQLLVWNGSEESVWLLSLTRNKTCEDVAKLLRKKIKQFENFEEFLDNIAYKSIFCLAKNIRKELCSFFWVDYGAKMIRYSTISEPDARRTEKMIAGELESFEA